MFDLFKIVGRVILGVLLLALLIAAYWGVSTMFFKSTGLLDAAENGTSGYERIDLSIPNVQEEASETQERLDDLEMRMNWLAGFDTEGGER